MAYGISRCLTATIRIVTYREVPLLEGEAYVYCFWHNKQLLPICTLREHGSKQVALVSPSRDGDILSCWLQKYGFEVVRGSSSRQGIRSLAQLIKFVHEGYSVGITPDGPRGPLHQVKPGAVYLAQKTGVQIIPVGIAYTRKWLLKKTWDVYEIPKPFSKAFLYMGAPMYAIGDIEIVQQQLQQNLQAAEEKAASYLSLRA
jgi:lysophospholipid acyltransferase (LPLAT)-like uncharacterized protein